MNELKCSFVETWAKLTQMLWRKMNSCNQMYKTNSEKPTQGEWGKIKSRRRSSYTQNLGEADPGGLGACPQKSIDLIKWGME
jgi:hypothetical protein